MDISKLSDEQKSVALAKARGWEHKNGNWYDPNWNWERVTPAFAEAPLDLYDPANMALAWRVHIWAKSSDAISKPYVKWAVSNITHNGIVSVWWWFEDAQRLWLDKILELVVI